MLRVCDKLRDADAKSKRLGLGRAESDYLHALLDAMANMDRLVEVEVLKSLGDVNLEKGKLDKNIVKFGRAMAFYRTALLRCFVNEDIVLEAEAIKSLGDVYLKRGRETRDTTFFTKATALYSTALARANGFQSTLTVALIHRLLYTAKIRQRIGEEVSLKLSQKQQEQRQHELQQRHAKRKLSDASSKTDVIADTAVQWISSYEERLTTGDRALTNGNLDVAERKFASALKLIHDPNHPDQSKEADCLCRLGDVYVQRGKRTRDGRKFTQAAALYNAAMARTDKGKDKLMRNLQNTEQWFLQHSANVQRKPSLNNLAVRHKARLQDMRACVKLQLEVIDQQHNPYQYNEDNPVMRTVEAERAEAVKALFKSIAKDRQCFIQDLVGECIDTIGPPPCKYAFIGLGSQATELVTPFSDLEFAILIEDGKDNGSTRKYFLNLTHYLHLKVINLGETILPAMAIPSLNDFQSEDSDKNWFFDSVTPRGFAFDGFMPWASKTPFGRDQTKTKPPVSLIQTPANLARFQQLDVSLAEGYHLSDILRRVVFMTDIATSLHNLGLSWQVAGDQQKAISYYEQSLAMEKTIYGDNTAHPDIAGSLQTLGSSWRIVGNEVKAISFHEKSLTMRKTIYGENAAHPDIAASLACLGLSYRKLGEHKDIAASLYNLGSTWSTLDDHKKAVSYFDESLTMRKAVFGDNTAHLDIAESLSALGLSWSELGDQKKAISYHEQALTMTTAIVGGNKAHPDISSSLYNLGLSWTKLSDQKKAIKYYEQALTMRKTLYGNNTPHSDIAMLFQQLGVSWSSRGDQKKAVSYYEQSLAMKRAIYGDNTPHPDIAASLLNLGASWDGLGDQRKAIGYYEEALTMEKTITGQNIANPDIAVLLFNLGISWSKIGDEKKAISFLLQATEMAKTLRDGNSTVHKEFGFLGMS
ncbi:TTC28 [Branchiostoma lanceolatum]|uniref:TTC28 protein n=1 Tax=Branchiostoma lanceolatum TaxID=7740 RepID=A0A8J9YTM2_BRALA|nr:TTC28 [Branchiostoma lanceolatum]